MEIQESNRRKISVLQTYNTGKSNLDATYPRSRKTSSFTSMLKNTSQEERTRKVSASFHSTSNSNDMEQGKGEKQTPMQENTYQLEPVLIFPYGRVKTIIENTLEKHLEDRPYDARTCARVTTLISDELKTRVKAIGIPRYRIVSLVHIGSMKGQDVKVASRCLWNSDVDTFAAATYRSPNIFAVGIVFGVYLE